MDRDEALKHLGLYAGATPQHVAAKFERLSTQLQSALERADDAQHAADLRQRLQQVTVAHSVLVSGSEAITENVTQREWIPPTDVSGAPVVSAATVAPPRRGLWKGWVLLLLVLTAMAAYVIINFSGMAWLDSERDDRALLRKQQDAKDARDAWQKYRQTAGIPERKDAERANESFLRAEQDLTRGFAEEAGVGFSAAFEGFMGAFRAEEANLEERFQREVNHALEGQLAKFPFDEAAEAGADFEALTKLLHPNNGTAWQVEAAWKRLGEVTVAGLRVATSPEAMKPVLERCRKLRDLLFHDAAAPGCVAGVRLADNALFARLTMEAGGTTVATRSQAPFTMVQFSGGYNARLVIDLGRDGVLDFDYRKDPWGMQRLLARMEFVGESSGVSTWQFDLEQLRDGKPRKRDPKTARVATISLQLGNPANPFAPGAFAAK